MGRYPLLLLLLLPLLLRIGSRWTVERLGRRGKMRKGRENGRRGGKGGGNDNGPAGNNSLGGNVPERREEVSVAATEIAAHYASLPPLSSRFKRVSTRDPLGSWKRRETVISDVVDRENGSTMGTGMYGCIRIIFQRSLTDYRLRFVFSHRGVERIFRGFHRGKKPGWNEKRHRYPSFP